MALPTQGRWQVTTEASVYLLDLDARTATRVPDAGAGSLPGLPPVVSASLRRDHQPIALLELIRCEVGSPLQMIIDVRRDGIATVRSSTYVCELREL